MSEDPAPPNKQQLRTERSTNALIEAAAELIVDGGLDAVTFAAIGERAGYSRGLVTARFGNKDNLIDALIERYITGWSHKKVLPRIQGVSGREAALVLVDAIRAQAAKDPRAIRVLYTLMFEAVGGDDGLRRRFAKFHEGFRADVTSTVKRGQCDGSVRADLDPEQEGALLVSAIRGIAYQWLLDPQGSEPVAALAHLRDVVEERLRPR
ncbi:MAG: TetR/AcrR family transcriptional regulator [Actinomycetota bacterium]